jgi:SOS-response transcriptional repressor LexA
MKTGGKSKRLRPSGPERESREYPFSVTGRAGAHQSHGYGDNDRLELNPDIFGSPDVTLLVRMEGNSFQAGGVLDGFLLVADCSLEPTDKQLVVVKLGAEQLIRRIIFSRGRGYLTVDDSSVEAIEFGNTSDAIILGVITSIIPVTPS